MKNSVLTAVIAATLIISSLFIKAGLEAKAASRDVFSLYGYEGVLYRLNNVNGRIDVLMPSNEAALLFPVGQIQLPGPNEKLNEEQKKSFSQNIRTLSQYIQAERVRSLGLPQQTQPEKRTTER